MPPFVVVELLVQGRWDRMLFKLDFYNIGLSYWLYMEVFLVGTARKVVVGQLS